MIESITCTFKVAMDKEQAELENHRTVSMTVNFPDDCLDSLVADAMKSQIIKWQGQIRKNWDRFEVDGAPSEITYGQALYESRRGVIVRKPTDEDVENFIIGKLTQDGIMYLATEGKMPPKDIESYWK